MHNDFLSTAHRDVLENYRDIPYLLATTITIVTILT
jgi:hypothetical protein